MEVLDEAAVEDDDAAALGEGFRVGGDDPPRPFDVRGSGGEDLVGLGDGLGMNQGLAVEAEVGGLARTTTSRRP